MSQLLICNELILRPFILSEALIRRYLQWEASHISIENQMKQFNDQQKFEKALEIFDQYRNDSSIELSRQMITQAIRACTKTGNLRRGMAIHNLISSRIKDDTYMITSLIHFYMQCGETTTAESLFKQMKVKDAAVCGAMMKGYLTQKKFQNVIDLFRQLEKPNEVNTLLFFNACAQLQTKDVLDLVKQVLSKMPLSYYKHFNLVTSLIDALMKCDDVETAERIFNQLTVKNNAICGAMMKGYVKQKMFQKVVDIFRRIEEPDEVNTLLLFNACAQLETKEALKLVKEVLSKMPSSYRTHSNLVTSLIDALMKCGDVESAEKIYDQSWTKNPTIYGAMMKGYVKQEMFHKAIDLYRQIEKPNAVNTLLLFNACAQLRTKEALNLVKQVSFKMPLSFRSNLNLMSSYVDVLMKCGDVESAESIFNQLKMKNLSIFNAMMKGYLTQDMFQKTIDLFGQIEEPNEMTTVLLFNACANLQTTEALNVAKEVFAKMPSSFYSNRYLVTSLIDTFMKLGEVELAESAFRQRDDHNLASFASLISGYAKNNMPYEAIKCFEEIANKELLMQQDERETTKDVIKSNVMVYLAVIDALADICDPSKSELIVKQIPKSLHSHPYLSTALIHMWGKIGLIEKAEELFYNLEHSSDIAYNAMINVYGLNGKGEQALDLYHRIPKEYISEITSICILNACSHSGLIDDAYHIFAKISDKTSHIYSTMVDCLSRGGLFDQAKQLIDRFEKHSSPSLSMYMALLSGCRNYKKSHLAEEIHSRMMKYFPEAKESLTSATVLLANTTASSGEMNKSSLIREQLKRLDVKKIVGLSWTSVNGKFYRFRAHDQSHPRSIEIYREVNRMMNEVAQLGYQPDASWVTRPLNEGETIASALYGHSERLAIAWNFVENPKTNRIHVAKNLRVCGDCHAVTKLIASIRQCEIIVRDANRIHHFGKNGHCSCNDYF